MGITNVINKINAFLKSSSKNIEIMFKDGYFLQIKKDIRKTEKFLEIHTPGYDGTLPITEALEWVKWEIYDYNANGFL